LFVSTNNYISIQKLISDLLIGKGGRGLQFLLAPFSVVLSFHPEARFHDLRLTFLYNSNKKNSFLSEPSRGINAAASVSIAISYSIQTVEDRARDKVEKKIIKMEMRI
jgi:hypothetical protein